MSQDLAGLSVESSPDLSRDEHVESVHEQEDRRAKKKTTLPKNDVPAVPHDEEVGLYVLGLQEVVDVTSVSHVMKPYTDSDPGKKWKTAMKAALPAGYEKIAEQQLLGLLILIYASPDLAPTITSVSATSVGTGLMGYLGQQRSCISSPRSCRDHASMLYQLPPGSRSRLNSAWQAYLGHQSDR